MVLLPPPGFPALSLCGDSSTPRPQLPLVPPHSAGFRMGSHSTCPGDWVSDPAPCVWGSWWCSLHVGSSWLLMLSSSPCGWGTAPVTHVPTRGQQGCHGGEWSIAPNSTLLCSSLICHLPSPGLSGGSTCWLCHFSFVVLLCGLVATVQSRSRMSMHVVFACVLLC